MKNTLTRLCRFDAGHRIMNERFQCRHIHGHEYLVEMTFGFEEVLSLGYAIDFKEIKRVGVQWIEDHLDHSFIANPKDEVMLQAARTLNSKIYEIHLVDAQGYGNPTAETIAKELFFIQSVLLNHTHPVHLSLEKIKLQETAHCWVECRGLSPSEWTQLEASPLYPELLKYRSEKGVIEYDERRV